MFFKSREQREQEQRQLQARAEAERQASAARRAAAQAEEERRAAEEEAERAKIDAIGYSGDPKHIADAVGSDDIYDEDREIILGGALRAFDEGRPENLQAFFAGNLVAISKHGLLKELHRDRVDDSIENYITKPALAIIEKSASPRDTLIAMGSGLTPYLARTFLDLTLRTAVGMNNAFVCGQLLDLGADANCHEGRPLYEAYYNGFAQVAAVLLKHGADSRLTLRRQLETDADDDYDLFIKDAKTYPLPNNIMNSAFLAGISRDIAGSAPVLKPPPSAPHNPPASKAQIKL